MRSALADRVIPLAVGTEDQDQRPIRIRDDPAQPRPERRAGRDRERARNVGDGMLGRRAQIDEQRAPLEREARLIHRHGPRDRNHAAEQARAGLVDWTHPGEIAGHRWLTGEQRPCERVDLHRGEQPIVPALVPDRRPGRRRDVGGAQRATAVGREDRHRILVSQDHLVQRSMHQGGVRPGIRGTKQVRSSHRTYEQRSAREHQDGFVGPRSVGHRIADVLGGVAGRVERLEPERTEVEALPVANRVMLVAELGPGADDVARARQRGKLPAARDVVVVQVRLDDVRDPEAARARRVEIDVDVASRVDHRRHTGRLVRDERAEVAQALDHELLQPHRPRLHRGFGAPADGFDDLSERCSAPVATRRCWRCTGWGWRSIGHTSCPPG